MMPAATHFDPVLGIDVHIVQPPGPVPPVPVPHPYVGIVFDPFDYIPVIGSTVKINGMHRAIAGTAGKAVPSHIPIGGVFVKPPANEDENFMGSSTVEMDGDAAAYMALPCLSCQCIGMMAPPRLNPKKKTKVKSLVLPTSVVLPIPKGPPVLIGGPPTISLMSVAMHLVGPLAKAIGKSKKFRRGLAAFKKAKKRAFRNMKPGFLKCKMLRAEPVDVVTGEVVVDQQDFELPGRIPIRWTRHYRSGSTRKGVCGIGWETPADARLELHEDGAAVFEDGTGVATWFDALPGDEPFMEPVDGGRLHRIDRHYAVELKGGLTWYFEIPRGPWSEIVVAAIVDRCRNSLHFVRGAEGLREVVESAGRRLVVASKDGLAERIVLHHPGFPERRTLVRFTYDAADNLAEVYDALDHPYGFGYDEQHRLIRHTNRTGLSFYYEYDVNGRCVHSWGDGGLYDYHFEYDTVQRFTNFTDSLGHPWTVEYDERHLIRRETDPLGGITSYTYDEVGRTTSVTDPGGRTTQYKYDDRGNNTEIVRPDGAALTTRYDRFDKPVAIVDATGHETRMQWDARSLLVGRSHPRGGTWRYRYNGAGDLVEVIDALGHATALHQDALGFLVRIVDPLGGTRLFKYDLRGNPTAFFDEVGNETCYAYDLAARLTEAHSAQGCAAAAWTYDGEGNLLTARDANGQLTGYSYSGTGELAAVRYPNGAVIRLLHDTEERVVAVVNARNERHLFVRDPVGRVIAESDYWGATRTYDYNSVGELVGLTNAPGRHTTLVYDVLGRITARSDEDDIETFAYDLQGRLTLAENRWVRVERDYDEDGNLIGEVSGACRISNIFDVAGNRTTRNVDVDGGGERRWRCSTSFSYDALNRPERLRVNDSIRLDLDRGSAGQAFNAALGTRLRRDLCRDVDGGLVRSEIWKDRVAVIRQDYSYDRVGNLIRKVDMDLGTDIYSYDCADRVVKHVRSDGLVSSYENDDMGDCLWTQPVQTRDSEALPESCTRIGKYHGITCRYDHVGNLISRLAEGDEVGFAWNAQGYLKESARNGEVTRYAYDPLGRRIWKQTGERTTAFFWDGDALQGEAVADRSGCGWASVRAWIQAPNSFEPLAVLAGDGVSSTPFFFQNDPNGCPNSLLSAEGELVWVARLGAWGEAFLHPSTRVDNPLRLQGQYEDRETGLHYNRFRYYDPKIGRFISLDPLGLDGGDNPYELAPNISRWIDPLGLAKLPCSPKEAQKMVRKGQGPRDIKRIDAPEMSVPGSQWHAHQTKKVNDKHPALNLDGSSHDGMPSFSSKTLEWLRSAGWNC